MNIKNEHLIFLTFVILALTVSSVSIFGSRELTTQESEAGSFGISPPYIYAVDLRPGDVYEQNIRVMRSEANEEKQVTARFDDPTVADMIDIIPGEAVVFEKDQTKINYRFRLSVPEDAYNGEYKSSLYFAFTPIKKSSGVGIALGARADVSFNVIDGKERRGYYLEIADNELSSRLAGTFIMRTESAGEIYYVDLRESKMYFLEQENDFRKLIDSQARGISDFLLERIEPDFSNVAGVDSDDDGLSDTWEVSLGTDLESPDSDGDGVDDLVEFESGTSPFAENQVMQYNKDLAGSLAGFFLMQVDNRGQVWYVDPRSEKRIFLDDFGKFKDILKPFIVGISEDNFKKLLKN